MDYKETSKTTAIEFSATIGDFLYKGSYKYDAEGAITNFNGGIYKDTVFAGNFSMDNSGALNLTGVLVRADGVLHATNAGAVIDYVVGVVKDAISK